MKVSHEFLIAELTKRLQDLLMLPEYPGDLPSMIYDEPLNRSDGFSFCSHPSNPWTCGSQGLLCHIIETPELFHKYAILKPDGTISWRSQPCLLYLEQVFELSMLCPIGFILTSGGPARLTEIVMMMLLNVPGGYPRNVYFMNGMLVFVGSYNKNSHRTGSPIQMARIPLPKIGVLLTRFLVHVRPVFLEWQTLFKPKMQFDARYALWVGLHRPILPKDVTTRLVRFTKAHWGVPTNMRQFRQVIAHLQNENRITFAGPTNGTSSTDLQLGHSGNMDRAQYGLDARLPTTMPRSVWEETSHVSATWHMLYGHKPLLWAHLTAGSERQQKILSTITALQRSSSLPLTLSVESVVHHATVDDLVDRFERGLLPRLLRANQQALGAAHASTVDLLLLQTAYGQGQKLRQVAQRCTNPGLLVYLRRMLGNPEATFLNTEQAQVTQLMLEGERHIAYFAPTGKPRVDADLLNS